MDKQTNIGFGNSKFWLTLDNAAKIFPALVTDEFTAVIRLSVTLKQAVRIGPFFKAVSLAENRFPYFRVRLKKGFFWYYLEQTPLHFNVEVEHERPSRRFGKDGMLLRLMVSGNRITVETSHILTDGSGLLEFLKTVLIEYTRACSGEIPRDFEYHKPGESILPEEYEDSYKRYFKEDIPPMLKRSKAFHLPWPLRPAPRFRIMNIRFPLNEVKKLAYGKEVRITDYLVSIYLFILQELFMEQNKTRKIKKNKYLRVQVPVNLRNILPSQTMRNFSLFVMPEIDLRLGYYTFEEILKTVYHQIRLETDEKLINKNISRNVGSEKKLYVKSIPLFLKSLILRMKYYSLGTQQYSGVVTNLGLVKLPAVTEEIIDHFIFTPPPPNRMLKVACGIAGFNDSLVMSFGNISRSTLLEEKFIQFFKDRGIDALVESA